MPNISEFKSYKLLHTLAKDKSNYKIAFMTNDKDNWFIEVIHYAGKNGNISNISTIIKQDMDTWLSFMISNGWVNIN